MTFFKRISPAWIALILGAGMSTHFMGCSGKAVNEDDPAILYNDAEEDIKSDHYQLALDKLRTVKNKHPYSKQAVDALLRIGDVYFLQESYAEAAAAYEAFKDLHPKHERVAYAMFRMALSYFNDIPGNLARDLTPAKKALEAFDDYMKRFPTAAEAGDAKKDMAETRRILAEKELYIADFYYKRDDYMAARARYLKILDMYPESPAAVKSKDKLVKLAKVKIPPPQTPEDRLKNQ